MPKISFVCIGVQKAGTNSLVRYLSLNNDIFIKENEGHFFDKPKEYTITEQEQLEYENTFVTNNHIVGEKTPSYCYLQFSIDRIYKYNPNMKLILILREPINRLWSQHNMSLNLKNKNLDLDSLSKYIFSPEENINLSEITCNGGYYIIRGFYDEIIEYIYSIFPKENLYIAVAEEIQRDKYSEYHKIMKFLGSDKEVNITNLDTHIGKYKKHIPEDLKHRLYKIYKSHNQKLYEIMGRTINIWEEYYKYFIDYKQCV